MLRFYGLDLWVELDGPRLPFRRLSKLLAHLPPESATARAVLGADAGWSVTDELLVSVAHQLMVGNWQRSSPKKRPKNPPPRPSTPWSQKTTRRADVVALAQQLKDRR